MSMNLNRLKWVAIAMPLAFVGFLRLTTEGVFGSVLGPWYAALIFSAALSLGVFFFATLVFGWLDRSQKVSEARTRELQSLNDLGRKLTGSLERAAIVNVVLETAVELLEARAAALSLDGEEGAPGTWRALGDGTDDLERAAAVSPAETWRQGAAHVVTDTGEPALLVSAPVGGAHRIGVLYALLEPGSPGSLSNAHSLMHALANQASAALDRGRLFEDVQRRERHARALYEVGLEIVSSQDLQRVLGQVTTHACKLVHARAAVLCLVNETDGRLSLVQTAGDTTTLLAADGDGFGLAPVGMRPRTGDGPPATCPVFADAFKGDTIRSSLIVGSSLVGELCVIPEAQQRFTGDQRALVAGLADMAAIAIHNSRLLDRERQVAVLEERDHLAREMHDTLAQVLGYLHLKAATTRKRLHAGETERAEEELQEMQDLAHEAYVDVREAILGLRETVAPAGGIAGSLRQYLQKFGRQSGIEAVLRMPGGVATTLAPDAEIQLLRVVQEALTNVRKHAGAAKAIVRLENEDECLRITIEDDGQGFDASRLDREEGRSFGLRSMRERVERAGGRFSVESSPGHGTQIIVLLPLEQGGGLRVAYQDSAGG
jgi:two-component system nitrate/nitrite sensor histidine kinase NarX